MFCTLLDVGRWANFIHNTSDTKCVGFLLTPTNSPSLHIPTGCPTIQLTLPEVILELHRFKGSEQQNWPHTRCQLHIPGCHLCSWPTSYKFGSSDNSLLRFDNLLEELTELKKTLYLLLPYYYEGCNSERAKWKKCTGQGMGEGPGASLPSLGSLPSNT